ncbi:MAG: hypothetical protein KBA55_12420, partial [Ruminococcus sp.]|nr:hypothetical protein [Ruminococcus sp.]
MLRLYEILKTSKTKAAPDLWTRLAAEKMAGDGGKVRELTGELPLTFTANGQPLLDYLISGNMSRSGTPTPDSPIQPQETGERTGNLLQIPDAAETTKNGVTYHVNGNSLYINGTSTTAFGINIRNAFTLKAGTYTNQMYGFTGRRIYYSFNNVNTTMCTSDVNLFKTFTISEDTTYANALVWINNGVTFNNEKIDFALFEGDTPKEFDVYGYKIPISSGGVNLFDKDNADIVDLYPDATTREIKQSSNLSTWSIILPVEPNTTYTFT